MRFDLSKMTEQELVALNKAVVAHLRILRELSTMNAMSEFDEGDRVAFTTRGGDLVFGVVTGHNRKTVAILSEHGQRWRVHPSLLRRIVSPDTPPSTDFPPLDNQPGD